MLGNHRDGMCHLLRCNALTRISSLGATSALDREVLIMALSGLGGFGSLFRYCLGSRGYPWFWYVATKWLETPADNSYRELGWRGGKNILFLCPSPNYVCSKYGLVGSTEWGEDFTDWIREHVVAYINLGMFPHLSDMVTCILLSYTDTSASGSHLKASASPLLSHLLRSTATQIPHPTTGGRSLWDARLDKGELFGEKLDAEATAVYEEMESAADNLGINPLGSGSDYTVFLQYIGVRNVQGAVEFQLTFIQVASSEAGFSSTLHDPVYHYHSIFDSQHWQEMYGDPSFSRHVGFRITTRLRRN